MVSFNLRTLSGDLHKPLISLARPTRFEPLTFAFGGHTEGALPEMRDMHPAFRNASRPQLQRTEREQTATNVTNITDLSMVGGYEASFGTRGSQVQIRPLRLSRTLHVDDVSDSNDSIIQSSTDYNPRKRFPSMGVRCSSVDFVSFDSQISGTHADVKAKIEELL